MSNKSTGTAFEREFAQIFADRGFWVHCLRDNTNGQPFDLVAVRNNTAYAFDCKECRGNVFRLSRLEENQDNAMALWAETGNQFSFFAIRFGERIYLVPHRMLVILKEHGTKQLKETDAARYGQELFQWLKRRQVIEGKAAR